MLIIAAGMQKSGTVWFFNLINDLLISAGFDNARDIRDKYNLDKILGYRSCEVGKISPEVLERLLEPHRVGHRYVIKTHFPPSNEIIEAMKNGDIQVLYIYRDLRAVALSAYEYGKEMRARGIIKPFGWIFTIDLGILYARKLANTWQQWCEIGDIFMCRYEDLMDDAIGQLSSIANYLTLNVSSKQIESIVEAHSRASIEKNERLKAQFHFNIGDPQRFRQVLNKRQLMFADLILGRYLHDMGYAS